MQETKEIKKRRKRDGLGKKTSKARERRGKEKNSSGSSDIVRHSSHFPDFWKEYDASCIVFSLWSSNVRYNAVYERTFRNNFSNFCLLFFISWLDNLRDGSF